MTTTRSAQPFILLLFVSTLGGCAPSTSSADHDAHEERILRVENGLLTTTVLAGEGGGGLTITERMRFYNVPGVSVAVVDGGEIAWARGYGELEAGSGQPVDTATLFQAASISKPVAAMAALGMVEEGLFSLDDDVNSRLTSWQLPDNHLTVQEKVTPRRLLSHSAGTTVHGFPGYASGAAVPTVVQVLEGAGPSNTAPVRVDVLPGSLWRYSGGGTSIMQLLLSDVSGQPFHQLMAERVLRPAQMVHSTYEQPLPEAFAPRAARAHSADGSAVKGGWHTYPEQAAAGLWTTPSDLARLFLEVQQSLHGASNRILSQEMTREMLTTQAGEYGLGFALTEDNGHRFFQHGGANRGFRALAMAFLGDGSPQEGAGRGVFIMTNGDDGGSLAMEIVRAVAREYGWMAFHPEERVAVAIDRDALEELIGRYDFDRAGETHTITISLDGGVLHVALPLYGGTRPVHAAAPDRFFFLELGAELEFERDGEGSPPLRVRVSGIGPPIVAERAVDESAPPI